MELSDHNKIKPNVYTPPRRFGKIDIADFDPENYSKRPAESGKRR